FIGCGSMVSSNAMAVILEEFPHKPGTASSLAGTLSFGVGGLSGALLSALNFTSAWPIVVAKFNSTTISIILYLKASRPQQTTF
ncbi:Bcr/CflA family multidrug efflux transporter, partial [Erwinia amylovora]|nr:Bcr/CflA family multidrug efflux transporter [Erwinia amylovora]